MSSDLIRYRGYLYGLQKHKEVMTITMDIPISKSSPYYSDMQWQNAIVGILQGTFKEFKHSGPWKCFNCGKPARETIHNPMTHLPGRRGANVPRPLVIDQVYFICRDGGECRGVIDAENKQMAASLQAQHKNFSPTSRCAGKRCGCPLAGTCAGCFKGGKVMKCAKCKIIRYCSKECQKKDYSRHKGICATIKKVESNPEPSNNPMSVFD